MKQILLLIAVTGLILFSCNRPDDSPPASLNGKWRMIIVKENTSGSTITKPSTIQGNVDISFRSNSVTNGTFTGNTPTNEIGQNDYSIGANQSITIPNLSMTKIIETSWGNEFVDNIRSAQSYSFKFGSRLIIKTVNRTLTFEKI